MTRRDIDTSDIQAIVKAGFESLTAASYMLLRVGEPHPARQWLRSLAPTRLADLSSNGAKKRVGEAYQVAFTASGLLALGVDRIIVERF